MKFKDLFNNIDSCVVIFSAVDGGNDFVVKEINKAAEKAESVSRKQVIGKRVTQTFPGIAEFGLLKVLRRVWKTGKSERHPISFYKDQRISGWRKNFVYKLNTGEIVAVYEDMTEKKQSEESARENYENYRNIFEQSIDPIFILTRDGRFIDFSPSILDLLGYSRKEMLATNVLQLYADPVDRPKALRVLEKKGFMKDYEIRLRKKDGALLYCTINSTVKLDNKKNIIGYQGIIKDITEHRNLTEKYRRDYAMLQSIMESTSTPIYLIDKNYCHISFNSAHAISIMKLYGTQAEIGKSFLDCIDLEDERENAKINFDRSLKGELVNFRSYLGNPALRRRYCEITHNPIRDAENNVLGVSVFVQDLTERREAELTLESVARFPDENPCPILRVSKEGILMYANRASETLLNSWRCTTGSRVPDKIYQLVHNAIKTEATLEAELQVQEETFAFTIVPVPGLEYINFYALDITEQKRIETSLLESRQNLRNLANYLQSLRERERTSIAREIHDQLGQDLTALKIDLSWLKSNCAKDNKPLSEKLDSMLKTSESSIQTVKRISSGLRPVIIEDLGLESTIDWYLKDFEKRTKIRCTLSSDVEIDVLEKTESLTFFRIIQEVLTNVARHSSASSINLSIRQDDNVIQLEIIDNGRGITKREIADKKSLGLIGIRERAFSLGGTVDIKGTPGEGTTVTLSFPLEKRAIK